MAAVMQWHLQAKDSLELIWNIEIIIESGSQEEVFGLSGLNLLDIIEPYFLIYSKAFLASTCIFYIFLTISFNSLCAVVCETSFILIHILLFGLFPVFFRSFYDPFMKEVISISSFSYPFYNALIQ